jgi:hypothetical protein
MQHNGMATATDASGTGKNASVDRSLDTFDARQRADIQGSAIHPGSISGHI